MGVMARSTTTKLPPRKAGKLPLGLRLRAWWNGQELRVKTRPMPKDEEHGIRYERERQAWESARIDLKQRVWGAGFTEPGGAGFIHELVSPMGLNEEKSVLEIGAGLGGAARVVAEDFGAWVTALEPDLALAEAGMALSVAAGLGKRAPVQACDVESFEVKARGFDAVFSHHGFFTVHGKSRLFETVARALKPRGQLMFTDFMLAEPDVEDPALDAWREIEPLPVYPWSVADYREMLSELKFEIRVSEDITDRVRPMIIDSWSHFLESSRSDRFNDETAEVLTQEVELWTRRTAALDSGALRICRFHALSRDKAKLLSDW